MSGPVYRADLAAARISRPLDDMVLLFHRPSGATHVLASPAPEILDALADGPADVAEIARRLAERHELASEEGLETVLAARLSELAAAGLVSLT